MKCGDCTLCCKLINIPWMESPAGEYCKECSINKGCKIFNTILPKNCKDYQCAYAEMETASINLRPDNCHVIFEKITDNIMTGLVEPGYEIGDDVKGQIGAFLNEGLSVYLEVFGENKPTIIPANGVTGEQIFNIVQTKIKNGSSKLYN